MAFFRVVNFAESLPAITGEGVLLRTPTMADFEEWSALRERSRSFLSPWEPVWPSDDLTRGAFRRRLRRYAEDQRTDQAYPFFVFRKADRQLVGGLTLANVRRGVSQTGSLGYWMGESFAGQGFMTAAVSAFVPYAFATLRLHRIEAACIPTNVASMRLLERTGFVREGYAQKYLCINGSWQDHLLFARINERFLPDSDLVPRPGQDAKREPQQDRTQGLDKGLATQGLATQGLDKELDTGLEKDLRQI